MNLHNGKLFFDGTNVPVRETLEQFAHGKNIDQIADTLQGKVNKEMDELEATIGEKATRRLIALRMKKQKYPFPAEGTEFLTKHITRHPKICGGQVCFDGTRRLVAPVLKDFIYGDTAERIVKAWHGKISKEAIGEAIDLAIDALEKVYAQEL